MRGSNHTVSLDGADRIINTFTDSVTDGKNTSETIKTIGFMLTL